MMRRPSKEHGGGMGGAPPNHRHVHHSGGRPWFEQHRALRRMWPWAARIPDISVCIPAYEMHGRGAAFLARSLAALDRQTWRNFEVVVSDHSLTAELETLCRTRRQAYPLRYLRCATNRGNPTANTNFAARQARGAIIKLLHQDDFLFADDALERIVLAMRAAPARRWGGVGCIHVNEAETWFYEPHLPRIDPAMLQGQNRFGAPSVMFVRREDFLEMDEALIWVGDCELYYRMVQALGEPILLHDLLVAIRHWPKQVTHSLVTEARKASEIRYATAKHAA
jgi:glycosyltransferase involved in cell wall biosynthesis